jgi:riboflavin synthase
MFTGIIEEIGIIRSRSRTGKGYTLHIEAPAILDGTKTGDSIAVNGICLTVTACDAITFTVDVIEESKNRTNTEYNLREGRKVNLERAMKASDRLHGHIVQGHVDTVTALRKIVKKEESWEYSFQLGTQWSMLVVEKGSIAIDGVSLTISSCEKEIFRVSIIPHTLKNTIIPHYHEGDTVNLEFDILGKYILKALSDRGTLPSFSMDRLSQLGY